MEVNTAINISSHDKKILFALLAQYLPNTTIWAYGSRVAGYAQPWSDLDIVVFSNTAQKQQISFLKEAFEESNLSFRVDLLEWDALPDNFRTNICASPIVSMSHICTEMGS